MWGLELPHPPCPCLPLLTTLSLTDLSSMGINLSSVEQERDALQRENEKQQEDMAQWVSALMS